MKLVHFRAGESIGQGVLVDACVRVVPAESGTPFDLPARAAAGPDRLLAAAVATLPLEGLALLPPLAPHSQLICVGINYADHAAETGLAAQRAPAVFLRHGSSVVGHGQPLWRPRASVEYDYEGELAVVIGAAGRHIPAADAMRHVAGYACFMDGSVRDFQRDSVTAGKSFPRSGALGPWIATADEVGDPAALVLQTRINGELVQSAATATMLHSVASLVAYCSRWTHLQPGDVIATGTPAGVGARRVPPRWLAPGDEVEVSLQGVGTLRNRVQAED
jgi:2-keto-4-pentenoate hydratase/2-oxohepta-3-ene-1,7-dioic acid hydratase in catechol pathway